MSVVKGSYVLLLRLSAACSINVGALGELEFEAGWYAYVGSAGNGLSQRVGRHLSVPSKRRWHVDSLNASCCERSALVWKHGGPSECELGTLLAYIGAEPCHRGFGSSDCRCRTHLFALDDDSLNALLTVPNDGVIRCDDASFHL